MNGVLPILKPPGMTSHDVVALVRRAAKMKRVGHTGTLDPAAAGVLVVCLGQATRLVELLQAGTKTYIAEATFGRETDTLDAVGKTISQADASGVHLENLRAVLDNFRGTIQQTPPLFSAIKQDGKKLYELARAGADEAEIAIPTREVSISNLFVSRFVPGQNPRAMLHIECSGGTYIRSLVRDIGRSLGCGATMTFLVRTHSGAFGINECATLEEVAENPNGALIPLVQVLKWCAHRIRVDDDAVGHLANGRQVEVELTQGVDLTEVKQHGLAEFKARRGRAFASRAAIERVLLLNQAETLAAFAMPIEAGSSTYKPEKVFDLRAD